MSISIESFNLFYVFLSFILSVFGSYVALAFAIRIPSSDQKSLAFWLTTSALALGAGGIWSMHFVGMVALNTPMEVSYNLWMTAASLVLAVASCMLGLYIVGRSSGEVSKLVMAGCATGLGVAGMHYLGMAAMIMQATVTYNLDLVALSIVIAVVAATAALWLAFNMRGTVQRLGSAIIMGIAVCGMHYTGMLAVNMAPMEMTTSVDPSTTGLHAESLAVTIFTLSATLLFLLLTIKRFRVRD